MSRDECEAARTLIETVQALEARRAFEELATVRRFLDKAHTINTQHMGRKRREASHFNVFETLSVFDREEVHSSFLAFLLNPRASHDQGIFFLQSFFDHFLHQHRLPCPTREETFVHCEFTTSHGRLDIAVFLHKRAAICIENKTGGPEQDDQIARYQRYLASLHQAPRRLVVFLSPRGREPRTADKASDVPVVSLSYHRLAEWLKSLSPELPSVLGATLVMYAASCAGVSDREVGELS